MKIYLSISLIYAVLILSSGVYRYLSTESLNALWFGVVMGSLGLVGTFIGIFKFVKTGLIIHLLVILFVGGFFIFKLMGESSLMIPYREYSLVIFSLIMFILNVRLWLSLKKPVS